MLTEIKKLLSDIEDEKVKEKYIQIITTLFEKGYFPGAENIPVAKSGVSNIDGENGILTFRGYPVQELADDCSYEDVCFLLLKGDLPLPKEKGSLQEQLLKNKDITSNIANTVVSMDNNLHPMYMLSAGVLQLQSNNGNSFTVDQYNLNLHHAIQLIAKLPTLIGTYKTKDPNFAKDKTFDSFAQYILYCFNQDLATKDKWVNILDKLLILHADHTINNSTFSVRAVGSSEASIYASISSAINSLSGPLHGGANERVIKELEKIDSPDNVASYIEEKIANKEKIMGLGHRVYETYDPRALYLKENILPKIFNQNSQAVTSDLENLYNTAQKMEEIALDKFADKGIYPNVDFWSGLVLRAMDIQPEYFTTIFALGRIMGWCAHWVENLEVNNKIFRPNQLYDGFSVRHVLRD
ncbi:citrate synthase [Halanaerocella petrolearia]